MSYRVLVDLCGIDAYNLHNQHQTKKIEESFKEINTIPSCTAHANFAKGFEHDTETSFMSRHTPQKKFLVKLIHQKKRHATGFVHQN